MIRLVRAAALALCIAAPAGAETPAGGDVALDPATGAARLEGRVAGDAAATWRLGAEAGQRLELSLASPNPDLGFALRGPGAGPGEPALAEGQDFADALPVSGFYTIAVRLDPAAAGAAADYALEVVLRGDPGETVAADFADGLTGGPDFWRATTGGGALNLRAAPSAAASVVGRAENGATLANRGCRMAEGRRWCAVETTGAGGGLAAWAAGDYLREAPAP